MNPRVNSRVKFRIRVMSMLQLGIGLEFVIYIGYRARDSFRTWTK